MISAINRLINKVRNYATNNILLIETVIVIDVAYTGCDQCEEKEELFNDSRSETNFKFVNRLTGLGNIRS